MNKDTMMRFAQQLSDAGYTPRSYSGRGMYGRHCLSFSASGGGGTMALLEVDKEIAKEAGEPRTDSMGMGTVYYWPSIECEYGDFKEFEDCQDD